MPANKKYLSSPLQRFAKISAGLVGGYFITISLHMLLMQWWDTSGALFTLQFGGFILWAVLLIFAFLSKNGWKIWAAYLLLGFFFLGLVYMDKINSISIKRTFSMANRVCNIMFHTHTISGIFISALLYVIFFVDSISFLRDEISAWERNEPAQKDYFETADYDAILQKMGEDKNLYGRDITFSNRYFERRVSVNMSTSKDTTLLEEAPPRGRRGDFLYLDVANKTQSDYAESYSMVEFFYRLHFFAQLNFFGRSGYLLAGIVAFFFLFAVITGMIVHWKKLMPSFYVFRPKAKWKAMWTNAHVGLGLIGLPYQFMFAVTGVYLIVGYTIMTPTVQSFLLDDDEAKIQEISRFAEAPDYTFEGKKLSEPAAIAPFIEKTKEKWPDLAINELQLINYGDANMHIKAGGSPQFEDQLLGTGHLTFRVADAA